MLVKSIQLGWPGILRIPNRNLFSRGKSKIPKWSLSAPGIHHISLTSIPSFAGEKLSPSRKALFNGLNVSGNSSSRHFLRNCKRCIFPGLSDKRAMHPTDHFAIYNSQKASTGEFWIVQRRRSTFLRLNNWEVSSRVTWQRRYPAICYPYRVYF